MPTIFEHQKGVEVLRNPLFRSTRPQPFSCHRTLKVKARLQRVGREMKMLVENARDQTLADPGLLRVIARAHDIHARLMQSTDLPLHAIANQERVTPGYVSRLLRLPLLALPTLSPPSSTARIRRTLQRRS